MKCTMCGADNDAGVKFCTSCGMKFSEPEEEILGKGEEAEEAAIEETTAGEPETAPAEEAAAATAEETVAGEPEEAVAEDASNTAEAAETPVQGVEGIADEQINKAEEAVNQAAESLSDAASEALGGTGDAEDSAEEKTSEAGNIFKDYGTGYEETYEESKGYIGFAIGSLVCGILSLLCCFAACFGSLLSVAAIVLGAVAVVKGFDGRGFAIAGIITGVLGLPFQMIALYVWMAAGN